MATTPRPAVKTIPAKERERQLESELADYQRGYMILESAVEYVIEQIEVRQRQRLLFNPMVIGKLLTAALTEANQHLTSSAHPADVVEKIFCEGCHTFLSEASEQAGYCIKCERS